MDLEFLFFWIIFSELFTDFLPENFWLWPVKKQVIFNAQAIVNSQRYLTKLQSFFLSVGLLI